MVQPPQALAPPLGENPPSGPRRLGPASQGALGLTQGTQTAAQTRVRPQDTSRCQGHMVSSATNPKPSPLARGQGQPCWGLGEASSPEKDPLIRLERAGLEDGQKAGAEGRRSSCAEEGGLSQPCPRKWGGLPLGSGRVAGHACGHPHVDVHPDSLELKTRPGGVDLGVIRAWLGVDTGSVF